jgi:hypothetical protein
LPCFIEPMLTTAQTATGSCSLFPARPLATKVDGRLSINLGVTVSHKDNLQYFKSSHCDTLNGQFHKFRAISDGRAKADKVRDDLDEIIRRLKLVTLGVILPIHVHQQMLNDPATFGPIPAVPYRLAFQQILAECAKAMRILGRNNIVTFAHDDGHDFPQLHEIYKNFKRKNPHLASVMADFVPLDDKLHPPLQAADVAASVTYRYAQSWAVTPNADNLKRLRDSMYKVNIWGEGKSKSYNEATAPAKCEYVVE